MNLIPTANILRRCSIKLASGFETQYLSDDELNDSLNTPDDPTILNLYKDAQAKATSGVAAAFFTPIPKLSWSTYRNPDMHDYITNKRYKFAFPYKGTIYVNLNIKIIQQNIPSVPNSLFEICTHEVGHSLWDLVHTGLSVPIDEEDFADIVARYVAPRPNEVLSEVSAPKMLAQLQSILNDLRPSKSLHI